MDTVTGINENELSALCMEILDYAESIAEIFDKVDSKFELLRDEYKSSAYNELLNSYNSFRLNYKVIKDSIVTYSDDLITLIRKMNENQAYLTSLFTNLTIDTESKSQAISEEGK